MTRHPVLITGATGGLGRKCAFELAKRGYPILVGGRRRKAVETLCKELQQRHGVAGRPFVADLSSLDAVRDAVQALSGQPLGGLVANAGITTKKDQQSADGYELTFAVNVLAHQLLFRTLAGQLTEGSRVVIVSSGVHEPDNKLARRAGIPIPRWVGARNLALPNEAPDALRIVDGQLRYSTSKLANILQARGLQAHFDESERKIDVFAIDPGLMVDTNLARELPTPLRLIFKGLGRFATFFVGNMRLSSVSAQHIASLIDDEAWSGQGFSYLDGDEVKSPSEDALRDDYAQELWRESENLLGLTDGEVRR